MIHFPLAAVFQPHTFLSVFFSRPYRSDLVAVIQPIGHTVVQISGVAVPAEATPGNPQDSRRTDSKLTEYAGRWTDLFCDTETIQCRLRGSYVRVKDRRGFCGRVDRVGFGARASSH